jgi:hypothetical protein
VIRGHPYYRCADRCSPGIPGDELEHHVAESMLSLFGSDPLMRRVRVRASGHAEELAQTEQNIAELDEQLTAGELPAAAYARVVAKLEAKRHRLASQPVTEAAETWEPTGDTVEGRWAAMSGATERGAMLRGTGVRVTASKIDGIMDVGIEWGDLEETRNRLAQAA